MIGTTNSESQKSIALPSRLRGKKLDLSTTVSWQIMCLLLLPTDCLWSEPDIKFIVSPDSPEIWRGETKYRIYEFLLSKILKVWFWILDILNPLEGGIISSCPFLDFTFKLCYCINRSVGVRDSCSFGFCPNYRPPVPDFGQLVQLFSDVKIQDLKVSLGLKILYIHRNTLYIQP